MKELLNKDQISRTLKRLTHEIIERNSDLDNLIIVGIISKGIPVAKILQENLKNFANIEVPLHFLDVSNYRDDIKPTSKKNNDFVVNEKNIILVDDVLYTGRTARAAMDALIDLGRFSRLQFAVLIDRGHRELPIKPDYVGKNIPTSKSETIIFDYENLIVNLVESGNENDN